jgi:dGTPase
MSTEKRRPFYEWQRALLTELADVLLQANGEYLDPYSKQQWDKSTTIEQQHRVIVDQIAVFTDAAALKLHNALIGSKKRSF